MNYTVELRGLQYDSSLQTDTSEYYRTLTAAVQRLLKSSFSDTQLEDSYKNSTILAYRNGNYSVIFTCSLAFRQTVFSESPRLIKGTLTQGLSTQLDDHKIPITTHGYIRSATLVDLSSVAVFPMALKYAGGCSGQVYSCQNGQCLTKQNPECDGAEDCSDGSDEVDCSCGSQPALQKASRIVGGSNAALGKFPWQVSLRENNEHFCGAAVISDKWLVSAAHCFNDFQDPAVWSAILGTTTMSGTDSSSVTVMISQIIKHPLYNLDTADYDVAVLELDSRLVFNKYIQPICLPSPTYVFPAGKSCVISGWGYISEDNPIKPEDLQHATVILLEQTLCSELYSHVITDQMLCAGYLDGKVDSCQGDSGGPLACEAPSGKFFLAGIVSWGVGCAEARRPGVYTRVTRVRNWILDTIASAVPVSTAQDTSAHVSSKGTTTMKNWNTTTHPAWVSSTTKSKPHQSTLPAVQQSKPNVWPVTTTTKSISTYKPQDEPIVNMVNTQTVPETGSHGHFSGQPEEMEQGYELTAVDLAQGSAKDSHSQNKEQ